MLGYARTDPLIGPPTGSRASITPCATSSAAASASSRVAKLPIGYPDSLNEYVGLTSTMVYSQTHVSSSFRVDHKWIDRPLYLDSVSTFPPSAWTSEIWLVWVCKSRQRSACIDAILHLLECGSFRLLASFSLSFVPTILTAGSP